MNAPVCFYPHKHLNPILRARDPRGMTRQEARRSSSKNKSSCTSSHAMNRELRKKNPTKNSRRYSQASLNPFDSSAKKIKKQHKFSLMGPILNKLFCLFCFTCPIYIRKSRWRNHNLQEYSQLSVTVPSLRKGLFQHSFIQDHLTRITAAFLINDVIYFIM